MTVKRPPRRPGPAPARRLEADPAWPLCVAIDTSGAVEVLTVVQGDVVLGSWAHRRPRGSGAEIAASIPELLRRVGRAPSDVSAVAVVTGPGAFTGLRVGIAMGQGLAAALGVPAWGFDATLGWALTCTEPGRLIAVLLDARRGEIYTAIHRVRPGALPERVRETRLEPPAAFVESARQHGTAGRSMLCVGDGARLHRDLLLDALGDAVEIAGSSPAAPDLGPLAVEALRRLAAGDPGLPGSLQPVYLRDHDGTRHPPEPDAALQPKSS